MTQEEDYRHSTGESGVSSICVTCKMGHLHSFARLVWGRMFGATRSAGTMHLLQPWVPWQPGLRRGELSEQMPQDSFDFRFRECCVGLFKTSYDSAPINWTLSLYTVIYFNFFPAHFMIHTIFSRGWDDLGFVSPRSALLSSISAVGSRSKARFKAPCAEALPKPSMFQCFGCTRGSEFHTNQGRLRLGWLLTPFMHFMPPFSSDFCLAVNDGARWMINIFVFKHIY